MYIAIFKYKKSNLELHNNTNIYLILCERL